ncbi:GtrA family protein [Leuconostoc pseudomesenteroides]|uniref:GtrA family protein n=1 Tax=Leuconostoc pseudomesenteroides TaxID=33968 RepID=UPI0032DEE76E
MFKKLMDYQKFRFMVVGVLNTGLGYIIFLGTNHLLHNIRFGYMIAYTVSYILSLVFAFVLHRSYVFKDNGNILIAFLRFALVNGMNYGINLILLPFLVEIVKINSDLAQLLITFLTLFVSYFGNKYFTFRRQQNGK